MRPLWMALLGLSAAQVKVCDPAPALQAPDEQGQVVALEKLRGQWVVLFFYPHDDTPGCTRQAKEFSRLLPEFRKVGAQVYGISTQTAESHQAFKKKHALTVPLLVDPEGKWAAAFGVKRFAGMCSRDVVVISPEGKIALFRQGVSPDTSAEEVLRWLRAQK